MCRDESVCESGISGRGGTFRVGENTGLPHRGVVARLKILVILDLFRPSLGVHCFALSLEVFMPLHPQVQSYLDDLAAQDLPGWDEYTPEEGREAFSQLTELAGDAPELQRIEDKNIADDLAIRVYSPSEDPALPAVMYFHGGGWVFGDLETHDALCRSLAKEARCVVVSVDYRLAPEHKFPAAIDDCYAATCYVAEHADELGIDPKRMAVAGDSAGGNLAAAVAIKARYENGPALKLQLLIYPAVDPDCNSATCRSFATDFGLTKAAMAWFWGQYLGNKNDAESPYASPIQAEDLHGLPPAHVITAEFDVLREEGESYAAKLLEAEVPTTTQRYAGMIHGFIHFRAVFEVGNLAVTDMAAVLKQSFGIVDAAPSPTVGETAPVASDIDDAE